MRIKQGKLQKRRHRILIRSTTTDLSLGLRVSAVIQHFDFSIAFIQLKDLQDEILHEDPPIITDNQEFVHEISYD